MPSPTAASWVKFFTNADIPNQAAATYAHVFVENRIQMDMLMDLNKEYLREMGITTMGDIIAILRHAKKVYEQSAREKVLSIPDSDTTVPIATVSGTPNTVTLSNGKKAEKTLTTRIVSSVGTTLHDVKPRRVLPEHEGKYKITLPSGSTVRSKEILEKKVQLTKRRPSIDDQMDVSAKRTGTKRSIFDRLTTEDEPPSKSAPSAKTLDSMGSPTSSSIFSRLGGRNSAEQRGSGGDVTTSATSGILKKSASFASPTSQPRPVERKVPPLVQKVILVKRIPAKAATLSSDEDDDDEDRRLDVSSGDTTGTMKSVSFSEEDEVLEIAPRKSRKPIVASSAATGRLRFNEKDVHVKQRLGTGRLAATGSGSAAHRGGPGALHGTRKVVQMKPSPVKPSPARTSMKADTMMAHGRKQPIQNRLSLGSRTGTDSKQLWQRLERFSLDSKLTKPGKGNSSTSNGGSVFNRLGYNRK
ncbi:uncharacterized protein C19orf47 homolog [Anopheles cruzii]|uniref:uncharacterized protein C19orf47 homolog n=1 Tax=Anopheles cruzii TaxID=68878 RepID=UPI0022EC5700|nr:uncharacterized protein C19orf47 homolog [Anopheles cruzii]